MTTGRLPADSRDARGCHMRGTCVPPLALPESRVDMMRVHHPSRSVGTSLSQDQADIGPIKRESHTCIECASAYPTGFLPRKPRWGNAACPFRFPYIRRAGIACGRQSWQESIRVESGKEPLSPNPVILSNAENPTRSGVRRGPALPLLGSWRTPFGVRGYAGGAASNWRRGRICAAMPGRAR
jgi:hypothetical protein